MILKGQKDRVERKVTVWKRGDGDKKTKVEFYLVCKPATVEQQMDLNSRFGSEAGIDDEDFVREWSDGWKGLKDAEDNDIDYNDQTLAIVMNDRDYREAIITVLMEAVFGRKIDFTVKNS